MKEDGYKGQTAFICFVEKIIHLFSWMQCSARCLANWLRLNYVTIGFEEIILIWEMGSISLSHMNLTLFIRNQWMKLDIIINWWKALLWENIADTSNKIIKKKFGWICQKSLLFKWMSETKDIIWKITF